MTAIHRIKFLYVFMIVAILVSLTTPTIAFAQDEVPPASEGSEPPCG
jgi:hypothetical protein